MRRDDLVTRAVAALVRLISEHGAPNRFMAGEVAQLAGVPAMQVGQHSLVICSKARRATGRSVKYTRADRRRSAPASQAISCFEIGAVEGRVQ